MGFSETCTPVINEPSPEELQFIKDKLQEDDGKFQHQLDLLHNWLDTHPQIPKNYDKNKIMNFLRACKYDMEKCKKKLEAHFYVRHEYPHVFSNLNPRRKEIEMFPSIGNALFFPNLTPTGERIFFLSVQNTNVDAMDVITFVKYSYMCYDIALRNPFPVTGDVMVLDGSGFTMKHFLKCINTAVKDSIEIAYKGYLVRLKAIYVVNTPSAIDKMVAVWRMLLTEKIRNRIVVSKTHDILLKSFPEHCLPEEYGGSLPKINDLMQNWYHYLVKNETWFQDQESCKSTVRPDDKVKSKDEFGVEGSFRKLTID